MTELDIASHFEIVTELPPRTPWAPKAPVGPCVRRRRTYAPCRDVHRTSVDDVCARCDVAENVEANKLGLYMGTGAQKLEEPIAHQCWEGLGPNILIDVYIYISAPCMPARQVRAS